MRKNTPVLIGVLCVCAVAVLAGTWYYVFSNSASRGPPDDVTVGLLADESSGLVYIAQDQGYFAAHGLNLTLKSYPNGVAALQAMKKGEVNFTLSSEFPLVAEILGGQDLLIAGSLDKYYGTVIVGRQDHGIRSASDLVGKNITISKNSAGEFYLGRFLELHGIPLQAVTLVNRPADAFMTDISANGSIDAVVTTPQNAYLLVSQPGNPFITIPVQNNQATYKVVAGNREWLTKNPRVMARFLGALDDAARYAVTNPDSARAIVSKRVNMTDDRIRAVWPDHHYTLSLDQSLLLAMEDEARWMIRNNLTQAETVPNFLD